MKYLSICSVPFRLIPFPRVSENDRYALMDGKSQTIFIDASLPEETRDLTLIHEWLHGVFEHNCIDHNEQLVGVLSTELYRTGFRIPLIESPDA
jgi:hypothetical protein